jgi:hypothetical protein
VLFFGLKIKKRKQIYFFGTAFVLVEAVFILKQNDMNRLAIYLHRVLSMKGIGSDHFVTVNGRKGESHAVPVLSIVDCVANLKKPQRDIIERKFNELKDKDSELVEFLCFLARPMVNRRM